MTKGTIAIILLAVFAIGFSYDVGLRRGHNQGYFEGVRDARNEIETAGVMNYLNCVSGPCPKQRDNWLWLKNVVDHFEKEKTLLKALDHG